uniref:Protein FAR1-related sequence 5-like n=1 Tax=Tanacetum cinerariifolium TaxID=118510 RepID=A0A699HG54_TANCI|nr:protein FAR1-related sequence 5-like [Tanacetum cinerariifolium]
MLVGKYSWVYNGWTLSVMWDEHNHPPAQHVEAHPYARRLTTDEYRLVEDLTKKNVKARNILAILKEQNKDNVSTIKDIYNAQSKIRKAQKVGETTMQNLMSLLHTQGYVHDYDTHPDTNELEALFFVHPSSFKIWRAFPHVLIIDATYKTNIYKMPFVEIVGALSYVDKLWLNKYKEMFVSAWTDQSLNFGEYIPLDSVDIFWKTLKVSWSESVEDDDIQCEDVLHHFKEKFNMNMQPTRHSSVSNTQTGRMHNLIPDLNEEPLRHSSFVSQTSMWHDSSTDEQIEIERLRKQIPKVVHHFILVSGIQNVGSDGNCGFRAVALGLGLSKDQWPRIRSDLVRELEAANDNTNTSLIIASAYKKVVIQELLVKFIENVVVSILDYRLAKVADLMMKHVIVPAVRFGSHSFAVEEQRLDAGYIADVALRITPPSGAQALDDRNAWRNQRLIIRLFIAWLILEDGTRGTRSKRPGKNTPQCYTKPLDSLKNWNNRFFWVDECVFPTIVNWQTNASKDGMPANGTYSVKAVRALDTHRTPIQKQPEMLLCLVEMDLFSLIRAPNPTKVKTGSRPRAPHEVPLLTLTAARVIEMDEPAAATDSSGVPSAIEKSPLDFAHEDGASDQGTTAPEVPPSEDVPSTAAPEVGPSEGAVIVETPMARESRKRGPDGIDASAPPKLLQRDHAGLRPSGSSHGGKSLAAMQLCMASNVFVSEGAPVDVSDPDPLSFADAPLHHPVNVAQSSQGVAAAGDPESENVSSPAEVGSPGSVYRPEWGVTNGSLLDTPEACQDLMDHASPPARQVAMGSQLRLRFEQEAKLLRKSVAQVAHRDQRIQARESEIKNMKALLETQVGMKRAAEDKSAGLSQELERMRAQFSKLQAAFEDYKRQQDQLVEQRCAKIDARLDALSIDFDEELYPHMLTAITGRRWVIGHGLRLALMKCAESLEMRQAFADVVSAGVAKGMSEGLKHGVEHGHAQLTVESLEAYDPEAKAKFAAALQALKDLKYPLLDQLEGLKDAPMDVIMAALYLESDTGGMPHNLYATSVPAPRSSPSLCTRRSDGVSVPVPTVVPQGLALLLVDAATQTDLEDA